MQLLGDNQRLPNKQRTTAERLFKRMNSVVMAVQFTCFLIDLARSTVSAPKTFKNDIWIAHDFRLDDVLTTKLNCTYQYTGSLNGYDNMGLTLDEYNHGFLFADFAGRVRFALIITALAIIIGAINKLLFDLNVYEFKWKNLLLHKEVITVIELIFLAMTIQSCYEAGKGAEILRHYIKACGINTETSLPFTLPFVSIYVATAVTLFVHAVSACIHLRNALSDSPPLPGDK